MTLGSIVALALLRVLTSVGSLAYMAVVAKVLGLEAVGKVTTVILLATWLAIFAKWGQDNRLVILGSKLRLEPTSQPFADEISRSFVAMLCVTLPALFLGWLLIEILMPELHTRTAFIAALVIPCLAAGNALGGLLRGLERRLIGIFVDVGATSTIALAVFMLAQVVGTPVSIDLFIVCFFCGALLNLLFLAIVARWHTRLPTAMSSALCVSLRSKEFAEGAQFTTISVSTFAVQGGIVLIGALFVEDRDLGSIRLAERVVGAFGLLLSLVEMTVQPRIAKAHFQKDALALRLVARQASTFLSLAALIYVALLAVLESSLKSFIIGDADVWHVSLPLLALMNLPLAFVGPAASYIAFSGAGAPLAKLSLALAGASVPGTIALSWAYGVDGLLWSFVIVSSARAFLLAVLCRRTLGFFPYPLAKAV